MSRVALLSVRSRRVARGEFGRRLRAIRESPREAAGIALVALALVPFALASVGGAFLLGEAIADAPLEWPLLDLARSGVGAVWVLAIVSSAFRTVATVGRLAHPDLVLSIVPVRELVAGKLLAEAGILACWFSLPVAAIASAFAVGSGEAGAGIAVVVTVVVLAATALPVGFVAGLAATHVATRYEPIVRVKLPLAIALTVVYLAVLVSGQLQALALALAEPLRSWPVSWLADLPLSATGEGSLSAAGAGAGLSIAIGATALLAAPKVAAVHWLSEPPRTRTDPGSPSRSSRGTGLRVETLLAPVAGRRTRAVAAVVWRRTVRSPIRLVFVLYPLFLLVEPARRTLESLSATGTVPLSVPPLVMAYLVWAGGMGFTLNALGDQGATLPTTLSIPDGAGAIVRGRMLVGALTTVPLATVVVGVLALGSPLSLPGVVALVAATAVGVVAALALATGVGVALPRFGSVSVGRTRRVVIPGKAAVGVYSTFALALSGSLAVLAYEPAWEPAAALVSSTITAGTPLSASVPVSHLRAGAGAVVVALSIVPLLSYLYAVRTVARYTLE